MVLEYTGRSSISMHIRDEIKQYMGPLNRTGDAPEADFLFPSGFTGFAGHFPGQPVLPGVCLIEAAVAMLETWHARSLAVRQVSNAKFTRMILPEQAVKLVCQKFTGSEAEGCATVAACDSEGARAAEFTLNYELMNKP
jgi:3-hydroxyacyl-[acyl-carrier-protein] dehydratase